MPASFTSTNSESEITPGGNPPPQFKTVENRSNLHYSSDHRQKFYNHLSDQYGYFSILPISPTESEAVYVLDGLFDHDTVLDTQEHSTDTGGASDHVFGLLPRS